MQIHGTHIINMAERGPGRARNIVKEEDPWQQVAVLDQVALICTLRTSSTGLILEKFIYMVKYVNGLNLLQNNVYY